MWRATPFLIVASLALAVPSPSAAQRRCDCTTIVAACAAKVTAMENWIDVQTSTPQCTRVDYFVDGLPFVATVVEGESRIDWISPRADPDILVQSCQVCADQVERQSGEVTAADSADGGGATPLEPLLRWTPEYPPQAQRSGLEGHVLVAFEITPEGTVENAVVTESEPAEVFDQAALNAVRRWRYAPDADRPATMATGRLDFSLPDMIGQLRASESSAGAQRADAPDLPRNRCVREEAIYNYGDMVEVGLINACSEPLLVYGCAEGTGSQVGRWVCTDSERNETLLIRPGDERIGTMVRQDDVGAGAAGFTYSDSFFIARAPNSQYWWLACDRLDGRCQENARMWIRSMHRQPATVDPRGRAAITLARSY
jgi:TonB family protein